MLINSMILASLLSIDSFGVGITYGIKDTKISLLPKIILFCISFLISSISIAIGNTISLFLPEFVVTLVGAVLLVSMGIWVVFQNLFPKKQEHKKINGSFPKIHRFFIKSLGITIQIIRDPGSSDLDLSKTIDIRESFYLGLAMSIDSLCSGIGISTFGVNGFLFPLFAASFQLIFISLGNLFGRKVSTLFPISSNACSILSGLLLIIIGFSRLFLS